MKRSLLVLFLACFATRSFAGSIILTQVGYTGPALDLSAFANGSYNFTFGPAAIPGGITFTSNNGGGNSGLGSVLGQGSYGLGGNGNFNSSPVYAGLDSGTGFMTFAFAAPVQSFGAFLNYCPDCGGDNPTISTLDSGLNVLSTFDLTTTPGAAISTPNGLNQFRFRGISESSAVISYFRLSGGFILATGTPDGSGVPEPGSMALLGLGLTALCVLKFRHSA